MKKQPQIPKIIGLIIALTILIIVISTNKLKREEAPEGEFKDIIGTTFVGSLECKKCHERIYLEWKTTLHSKMLQDVKANPIAIMGDFETPSDVRTFTKEEVAYTIGNQWKQRYLKKIGDDYFVLPAQYNIIDGKWAAFRAEDWQKRSWFKECAGCHATGVDPVKKTFKEPGIGCEACHGPGSNHVKAVPGYEILTIVNPARLTKDASAQICGSCHTYGKDKSGKYDYPSDYRTVLGANLRLFYDPVTLEKNPDKFWPSGDSKSYHQQYIDWRRSEHAKAGVTCIECHSVHIMETKFQTKLVGDSLCKRCHVALVYKAAHRIHTFGSCIACHMPRTVTGAYAGDERSHTFKFLSPELSFKAGGVEKQPNSCSGCHYHKDTPLQDLIRFLDAVRKIDMIKPFTVHNKDKD